MKRIISIIMLGLLLCITGCSSSKNQTVKITPTNLIDENSKLKPHIGDMITGCVKVDYKGEKKELGCKYEVWENGKLIKNENVISSGIINKSFKGEVSVSLRDAINDNLQKSKNMIMTVVIDGEDGKGAIASGRKSIETFNREHIYAVNKINNEIKVKVDKEVAILGITSTGEGKLETSENIEKDVKKSKWGLVFKVYLHDGLK